MENNVTVHMATTCLFLAALITGAQKKGSLQRIFLILLPAFLLFVLIAEQAWLGWPGLLAPAYINFVGQMTVTTVLGIVFGVIFFNPNPIDV